MTIEKRILLVFVGVVMSSSVHGLFEYDRAVHAAQNDQWEKAAMLMKEAVVDASDNPQVLYDAGVASYRLKEYDHAQAYFSAAGVHEKSDNGLKEQSLFNSGNTFFEQKKLEDSLQRYQAVLELNSKNERAQHNYEIVKKMLEEQQQQEQQEKNDQDQQQSQDKQDSQDKSQDQSNQNQSNQDQSQSQDSSGNNDNNNGNDSRDQQSKHEQSQGDAPQDDSSNKDNKNESGKEDQFDQAERTQDDKDQKEGEQSGGTDDHKDKQDNSFGQRDQDMSDDSNQQQEHSKDEGGGSDHEQNSVDTQQTESDKSSGQDTDKNKKEHVGSGGAAGVNDAADEQDSFDKVDDWLAQILKDREKEDAALNKQVIKATVGSQLAGQDGQNCW